MGITANAWSSGTPCRSTLTDALPAGCSHRAPPHTSAVVLPAFAGAAGPRDSSPPALRNTHSYMVLLCEKPDPTTVTSSPPAKATPGTTPEISSVKPKSNEFGRCSPSPSSKKVSPPSSVSTRSCSGWIGAGYGQAGAGHTILSPDASAASQPVGGTCSCPFVLLKMHRCSEPSARSPLPNTVTSPPPAAGTPEGSTGPQTGRKSKVAAPPSLPTGSAPSDSDTMGRGLYPMTQSVSLVLVWHTTSDWLSARPGTLICDPP
mmetsp:Transcript_15333/g.37174  ORF Transcript_15333/g.37174 Transcript_15333/m.37174 type:complete len:261 (-) Transcript_15333:259-1041(-)